MPRAGFEGGLLGLFRFPALKRFAGAASEVGPFWGRGRSPLGFTGLLLLGLEEGELERRRRGRKVVELLA